jgi:cob(I)alamin adenosyltransferase
MKIYTRTGDTGTTSLVGGTRIAKNAPRLEAYGTIDELNSHLGLLCRQQPILDNPALTATIHNIQSRLFDLGAYLATDNTSNPNLTPSGLTTTDIDNLEAEIDTITAQLPQLNTFILPGGCTAACQAHVCRTVCRRAERLIITLAATATVAPIVTTYINRLSDYLFTLARYVNLLTSTPETPWLPTK